MTTTQHRRLSRQEQREQTRARIVDSAARTFARRGFAGASLEEIAEQAGYSKGAVYSNFAGKDDLYLAVLDARFDRWLDALGRALDPDDTAASSIDAIARVCNAAGSDPEWCMLSIEFWLRAARDERLRRELSGRYTSIRARIAELIAWGAAEHGIELPEPAESLAAAALALVDGLSLHRFGGAHDQLDDLRVAAALARLLGVDRTAESRATT